MRPPGKIRKAISFLILGISLILWVLLLLNPGNILTVQHCPVTASGPSPASLQMLLAMNPISSLLTGCALMVLAMMLPKLILPIQYIYGRCLKRRRFWSAVLFVSGYVGVWITVGFFMIAAILGLNLLMPKSYVPAIGLAIIAIIWQCSPVKQKCLNRGHDHMTLAAFGWPANRDALLFGVIHGLWCVASGWALMLFPMLLPAGHNLAMILVTFVMISEHLEHPQLPRWRFYFRGKLTHVLFAQAQIKLKRLGASS
jgi:predicted metal-binding membrane protein